MTEEDEEFNRIEREAAMRMEAVKAAVNTLRPCRSPYCECDVGKCSHPGCYDARGEPLPPQGAVGSDRVDSEGIAGDYLWYNADLLTRSMAQWSADFKRMVQTIEMRHKEQLKMLREVMDENERLKKAKRAWQGITLEDKQQILAKDFGGSRTDCIDAADRILKERNA